MLGWFFGGYISTHQALAQVKDYCCEKKLRWRPEAAHEAGSEMLWTFWNMFLVGRGATPILCVCRKDRYEKDLILFWAEIAVKGNQKQPVGS